MTYLVTGAGGFVGLNLVEHLLAGLAADVGQACDELGRAFAADAGREGLARIRRRRHLHHQCRPLRRTPPQA